MIDLKACPLWLYRLLPFLRWWPNVTQQTFKADSLAAFTGALIVLPQAVAFATIAGLPPEYGLYAAMVPAIVAALWGSSWHLVSGPTTAISIVVFASISPLAEPGSPQFIGLVLTLTLLAGLIQLAMGLARLGTLVNFISHTVITGFTAGAAILIAASQIRHFFGIDMPRGAHFHEVLIQFGAHIPDIQPWVVVVGVVTLISGMLARRYLKKLPYMIVAMVAGSVVATLINFQFGAESTGIRTV
ncbi:MAG: SulP family inorganic anion transporter, partial [Polycyclovorans sp.]|nr:SulP family inorganic anion transporter [Polycyclovorans sp.]